MQAFPVFGGHHFDCIPGTAIQESTVGALAGAFLAADAKVWVNFNTTKWRMVFVRNPKHAGFDWTVFNTGRRTGTTGAAVCSYRQDARLFLPAGFAVAF